MRISKLPRKYMVAGLQLLILLTAVGTWLINRGSSYSRIFAIDDYTVSESAVLDDAVIMDQKSGQSGIFLTTPALDLDRGTYHVQVDYSADSAGSTVSALSGLGPMEMHCTPVELKPSTASAVLPLELSRSTDTVTFQVSFSGTGSLSISRIAVFESSARYKKNVFYAIILCLLISLADFFRRSDALRRRIIMALAGIFLISCYPLYTDYLTVGHDLPFHLLRFEAISQGLSQGVFPVKIHPLWANGQGYAVGIFYGDAFLYFPAFLRLLGFSIQSSYKIFVAAVNLGTVLCSYYAFRKIFASEKTGLLGCLAYTLAPYRLMDLYTRATVGEYTAMMVLPLVLCGFYLLFREDHREGRRKNILLIAFGLTGLIQSHVLSTIMIGFVIILTCILLCKKVFRCGRFPALLLAAGLTLLMNLNFIVPFLDFYQEDIMINSPEWTGRTSGSFQAAGMFPVQLFTLFQKANGGAWSSVAGVYSEATYGIGILLTVGIFLFLYLSCIYGPDCRRSRNYSGVLFCMLLSALLLFMSTCYFPWDALASLGQGIENVVYSLQFPWRLLAPATVLLTLVLCCSFELAEKVIPRQAGLLLASCMVLFAVNIGWYFYDFSFSGEPYRVYNAHDLNTMQMYSYDYLPTGTIPEEIEENAVSFENTAPPENFRKLGNTIYCHVSAASQGGYMEFPLLSYKYYRCIDTETLEELPVSPGTNNMVRVTFPGGYSGSIRISFQEPWFWRLAEGVSCVALAGSIILWFFNKKYCEKLRKKCLRKLKNFVDK